MHYAGAKIMPPCALCGEDRQLRHSHILPEFLSRPLYVEHHELRQIGQAPTSPAFIQKGRRERMLCGDCESLFQRHEDRYARYWYHRKRPPFPDALGKFFLLRGTDYASLKLFLLSLIWRASVAKGAAFRRAS